MADLDVNGTLMEHRGLLKSHSTPFGFLLQLLDCLVIFFSALFAHRIYLGLWDISGIYTLLTGIVILLSVFLFQRFQLYGTWRGGSFYREIGNVTLAWMMVLLITTAFVFINKVGVYYSRGWIVLWAVIGWMNLLAARISLHFILRWIRNRGHNVSSVVIVGNKEFSGRVAKRVIESRWLGFKILGLFHTESSSSAIEVDLNIPILGGIGDVAEYVQQHHVDQVWLAMPLRDELEVKYLLYGLRHSTADIRLIPDIFAFQLLNHSISEVAGFPVLDLSVTPMFGMNRILKTVMDLILTPIALLIASPLMLFVAIGVKWSSPGPVLFMQNRAGMDGMRFKVFKFRTMVLHRPPEGTLVQATRHDPRVTRFGALLRRTSLDELPQLFNVLRGEMSLVGPRPHAIEHNELYKNAIQGYMRRHKVKPGITGWAQVAGWRGESDTLEKMQKRVEYDLYYIENWSVSLDLWILILTVFRVLKGINAY